MVDIKLGSMFELSGATARTFEVVPRPGNYKDDAVYQRGLAIERALAEQGARAVSSDKKPNLSGIVGS
jgi:hypothetical protein